MNNYQKEVLVGSMLGDGNLRRSNENTLHTYFTFRQSIKNFSYYIFMRDIFHNLIRNNDHSYSYDDKRYGKTYKSNKFSTIGHVDFQYYYNLFYTDNASKIVPPNIADILTPISLAI
jgi:hypothetical protein